MLKRWARETNPVLLGYYLGVIVAAGLMLVSIAINRLCDSIEIEETPETTTGEREGTDDAARTA